MEKLSIKAVDMLIKNKCIDESGRSIYEYGMLMAFEVLFSFFTSIFICILWGKVIEGIIFFGIFIPLRSFMGGFHMKSYRSCYIVSALTFVGILGLSNLKVNIYIAWILLVCSTMIMVYIANKENNEKEGRHYFPRICLTIIVMISVAIINTVLGDVNKVFLVACVGTLVIISKCVENKLE